MSSRRKRLLTAVAAAALLGGALVYGKFQRDIAAARTRASAGGRVVQTRCGPVEYQDTRHGIPLLVVHGAGGGHDQGMSFARPLVQRGYPRGPSSLQFAIRHPDRCAALVLLVPLAWRPPDASSPTPVRSTLQEEILARVVGSDFVFWSTIHLARTQVMSLELATPVDVIEDASAAERERLERILVDILPISDRAAGMRNDAAIASSLGRYDLQSIRAPTLVVSLRDDLYGTFTGARYTAEGIRGARFVGYERGGHVFVGRHQAVLEEMIRGLGAPAPASEQET